MADHPRARDIVRARFGQQRRRAARVIDVTVGVDGSVYAIAREFAQEFKGRRLVEIRAGIHHHQPFARFDRGHVRKPSKEHDPIGDFFALARGRERMMIADGELAAEQLLGSVFYYSHGN